MAAAAVAGAGVGEVGVVNVTIGIPGRSEYVASAPGKIVGQIVELKSPIVQDMPYGIEDKVTKYVIIGDITEVPKTGVYGTMGDLLSRYGKSGKLVQGGGKRKSRKNNKRARHSRRNY